MKEFRELLISIGLPPWAISVVVIAATILLFFFISYFRRKETKDKRNDDALHKYASLQENAMLRAYRLLYEGKNIKDLTQKELEAVVSEADDIIMKPFTEYRAYLDDEIIFKIYDLHNILAQYKPHQTLKSHQLSSEAKNNLFNYKNKFLKQVENIRKIISKNI